MVYKRQMTLPPHSPSLIAGHMTAPLQQLLLQSECRHEGMLLVARVLLPACTLGGIWPPVLQPCTWGRLGTPFCCLWHDDV